MLRDSQLLQSLQMFPFDLHGQPMYIYGDPAYPLRIHLQALFHNRVSPQMQAYNVAMGEVCSSEGWLFEDVINYFKFLDSKKRKSEDWNKQCEENVCGVYTS